MTQQILCRHGRTLNEGCQACLSDKDWHLSDEPTNHQAAFAAFFGRQPAFPIPDDINDDDYMAFGYGDVMAYRPADLALTSATADDRIRYRIGARLALAYRNRNVNASRLEQLRHEIRKERISYGELAELQGLADQIDPGDVELLEWAGVPEFPEEDPSYGPAFFDTDEIRQANSLEDNDGSA